MIKSIRRALLLCCIGLKAFEAHAVNPMVAAGPELSFGLGADGTVHMWASNPIGALRPAKIVMATTVTPFYKVDCLFNWAERTYSALFAPTAASITLAPWYYRYYSLSTAYLGTSSADNHVYYRGPNSGYATVDVGELSTWLATANCQ